MIKDIYIVSHMHWDREWYITRERFGLMLVRLVDRLLEILDSDSSFKAFMLDGQAIILEDYLSVRPENESRLKQYIQQERILIGPWYILPDELLISGEAHIRNFIEGDRVCSRFGNKMNTGYLPDSFGHPSQMPQLLKGLGMDEIVFWRGLGPEIEKTEFEWEGPDGTRILALNMPFGYGTAACLPEDGEHFIRRIKNEIARLEPLTDSYEILLMNGSDHLAPQLYLPRLIHEHGAQFEGYRLIHATLPEYVAAIRKRGLQMKSCTGELRSTRKTYLLGGTLSSRMYIKQENYKTEQLLEKWVEPMAVLAWLDGLKYPSGEIRKLWRYALSNLPHDSICGCSVDEVHREMMGRYSNIEQMGEDLLHSLFTGAAKGAMEGGNGYDGRIVVFNPLGNNRTDIVEVEMDVNPQLVRKVDFDIGALVEFNTDNSFYPPSGIVLYDSEGSKVEGIIRKAERTTVMKLSLDNQPEMYEVIRLKTAFVVENIPAVGFSTFLYKLKYDACDNTAAAYKDDYILENEYIKVIPCMEDGTVDIYDKETGMLYKGCNSFTDSGDAGDEYTYSPPAADKFITLNINSLKIERVESSPAGQSIMITGELELPEAVTEDRRDRSGRTVNCHVKSIISIFKGVRRVDITTEFDNRAKDHRLRVVFPTGLYSQYSYGESIFAVNRRKVSNVENTEDHGDWMEAPCSTHPQKTFVDVNNGQTGLAVANRGLPEFEVFDDGKQAVIALTLLRCVGWLSRGDLLNRKGNGGWTLETPEAQCLGIHKFEYSVIPHKGNWLNGKVHIAAHEYSTPLRGIAFSGKDGGTHVKKSLLNITGPEIVISALKKAEKSDDLVIRLYNESDHEVTTQIALNYPVKRAFACTLDEKPIEEISCTENKVEAAFKPWQINTILMQIGS